MVRFERGRGMAEGAGVGVEVEGEVLGGEVGSDFGRIVMLICGCVDVLMC